MALPHFNNYIFVLQFREKRIEQEKELIERQNKWLTEELKSKTDELVKLRKEKVQITINLVELAAVI